MSLTGKDITKLRSLYESVYEPETEETELITEQTYKECLEIVILEAIEQSGLLDIEFEDEELKTRLVEEVLLEFNIRKFIVDKAKKVVTTKAGRESLKNIGKNILKTTGITLGGAGAVDTLTKDDVSGKRNMGLRTTASFLKNLPANLRATYTTVQSGGKDTGNKVVDITGTGLTQNQDIRKATDDKGRVITTTDELQKDNKAIIDKIRNKRNNDK
tara:strand:+ start:52 stop:699 length:648 start_codon:yes stop_codon:yes gene_type:complete